ncbi:HxlR family transcription regulator / receiver box response regulator [Natrialba magadii ATCC 43099]|uniref:HxlR family transcription regulator / receiver box response regulator n=1 Tax=Natrialba magadii (strain ATCC 43099 / DSM 3394 / CCM 3739 / CIP 104546 / IAM 13178 / JCM 8861 / NBRC 102185 / NCIMB 2190 / MS3) TaxID=547559 RepID=D3SVK6_NATMM|nr:winged helix-turn-helix transcriptional regulator [Natrialba magadii]ADD05614.1 HxlR family transcription regulator / receiver box response regulator [Natrialba magadii ATCC 43099]ELY29973.1 HxlR family transcriptional regulator [Natrialba magadii ATCC 43099]
MSHPPTPAESTALSILGTKWKPRLIVALATNDRLSFGDLKRELTGISGKVLSENLDELRDHGVVSRDVVQQQPRRVEYELTGAGRELYQLIEALTEWDATYATERGVPTVLLAEDDPRLRELYALWLQTDYDVLTVPDGQTALRSLDESVDVAVLARDLPTLDGAAVAAALETAGQRTPVAIITSADISPEDVSISADLLVRDPLSKAELIDTVEQLTRLPKESPIGRDIRARRHRLAFVERHLGPTVSETEPYQRAADELTALEQERERTADARAPWRRLRRGNGAESDASGRAKRREYEARERGQANQERERAQAQKRNRDRERKRDRNSKRDRAAEKDRDHNRTHDDSDGDGNE